jgi:hypothetical protein
LQSTLNFRILLVTAGFMVSPGLLSAHDVQVKSAAASDARCSALLTQTGGSQLLPARARPLLRLAKVALGERFGVDGKERQIGVIVASQAEEDMLTNGLDIRKGEWTYVATENLEDIPSDKNEDENLTWLFIRKCQPAF